MNITLRQLEVFCAIARLGHVSRAAKEIALSQSAASMALAELERQLGEQLFDRIGKKLMLNSNGSTLLPKALKLLSSAAEIENLFSGTERPLGELKVGASSTIGNYLMPGILARLSNDHPQLRIALQIGNTEQIIDALLNYKIDIGLIEGLCSHPRIQTRIWRSDELIIFVHPKHPLAAKSSITLNELADAEWILRERGSGTRTIMERATDNLPNGLNIKLELGHTEAVKGAVRQGLGISCLSRLAVQEELDHGTLKELPTPELDLKRNLYILLRQDKFQTELLRHFIQNLEIAG